MVAYAARLCEENYGAIRSEKPDFDLAQARAWVEDHGAGFFIRDESSKPFDCSYMPDIVFYQIYIFDDFNKADLFHRIVRMET